MMMDKQKARVITKIYGQTYTVVGAETSEHVQYVASLVDERMREMGKHNRNLDSKKVAVLAAVNIMNDFVKLEDTVRQLEEELNNLKG